MEDLRVVYESTNRQNCSDRALVLASVQIPYQLVDDGMSCALVVPAEHSARAAEELKLYDQIVANLDVDPPVPDLVIYLQAPVDALLQRLARRNASHDRFVDRAYLEKLTDAYARFFHAYDDGPLLIVNASQIDPVNNDADFEQLFRQIEGTTGGRHFFNPVATAFA